MNIPITIFTGFLGAGKTTFINEVIRQHSDKKFGFIINEFGEEGIDGKLIESTSDELIEMNNGCLCCVVRDDLISAVNKLVATGKIEYLIIETSGLAEPESILRTLNSYVIKDKAHIDAVICLLDAINFQMNNENYKVIRSQIHFADIVLINKSDSLEEDKKEIFVNLIREVNKNATIVFNHQNFNTDILIDNGHWQDKEIVEIEKKEENHDNHEHDDIDEIVYTTDKVFSGKKLQIWLKYAFPDNIIRAKGLIKITHNVTGKEINSLFQSVGGKSKLSIYDKDITTSRLVFIGQELDQKKLFKDLDSLLES